MSDRRSFGLSRRRFLQATATLAGCAVASRWLPGCRSPKDWGGSVPVPAVRLDPASKDWGEVPSLAQPPLFDSIFMGGFECSTHLRKDGLRLDMIAATKHDKFALADYQRLQSVGMRTCRDAARWHLIEPSPGQYSFKSLLPMAKAAQSVGMQVIWDLQHYGWPDHTDVYSTDFPTRFARYARATAKVLDEFSDPAKPLFITPINEISFLSWAGGDNAYLNPYDKGRGHEMKRQLTRAAIEAMEAIKEVVPRARFMHCDPIINVSGRAFRWKEQKAAEAYRMAQYQAYDMMIGEVAPSIGGHPKYLDIIGVNYYRNNQTYYDGEFIGGDESAYKPLADMIIECWNRYRRPMLIAETGIEDMMRAHWLRYVAGEAATALKAGVQLHGITWFPIVDHPGWEDDRHCHNGLWGYPTPTGDRPIEPGLAAELQRQLKPLTTLRAQALASKTATTRDWVW